MKIIVKNNTNERQSPEVTIDTSTCHYPYAIREALQLALELDGYTKETINEVFGRTPVVCAQDAGGQAESAQEQDGYFTNNYSGAFDFLVCNGIYMNIGSKGAAEEIIRKANELWKQQNNQ